VKNGLKDRERREEQISLAVEKFVKERLGLLENAGLLGNKLYRKTTPEEAELYLRDKAIPHVNARMIIARLNCRTLEKRRYCCRELKRLRRVVSSWFLTQILVTWSTIP
jgi:hypothetical protein